jgi:hypothetical protein
LEAIGREVAALLRDPLVDGYIRELRRQAAREVKAAAIVRSGTPRLPQGLDEPSTIAAAAGKRTRHYIHTRCGVVCEIDGLRYDCYTRTEWPRQLRCYFCGENVMVEQLRFVEEHVLE